MNYDISGVGGNLAISLPYTSWNSPGFVSLKTSLLQYFIEYEAIISRMGCTAKPFSVGWYSTLSSFCLNVSVVYAVSIPKIGTDH
jgi:hypothetical protein